MGGIALAPTVAAPPVPPVGAAAPTPLDLYLAQQHSMTAVAQFSRLHDAGFDSVAERHRALLPRERPGHGRQYAFEVDLDACTGCKACVTACHALNGLDADEAWRMVELLVPAAAPIFPSLSPPPIGGSTPSGAGVQHVSTGCHHCIDPACLAGCPVDAYEKDPVTGIVAHLDDQCIGCSYCTLMCPYDVPRYSPARGIVRKCDMCSGRLADGEAPACVQGCPNEAISITLVDSDELRSSLRGDGSNRAAALVAGAPPSALTVPSTRFVSKRGAAPMVRADDAPVPAHDHRPLGWMLVLSQLSVGLTWCDWAMRSVTGGAWSRAVQPWSASLAAALAVVSLTASLAHLGRPRYAFRAVLGVRHSWLSREVVAFAAYSSLAIVRVAAGLLGHQQMDRVLSGATAAAGAAGLFSSIAVYAATGRPLWSMPGTTIRFTGTALSGGAVALVLVWSVAGIHEPAAGGAGLWSLTVAAGAAVVTASKLIWELQSMRDGVRRPAPPRTAALLRGPLRAALRARITAGIVAVLLAIAAGVAAAVESGARNDRTATGPGLTAAAVAALALAAMALAALVAAERRERSLFFMAATAPRSAS